MSAERGFVCFFDRGAKRFSVITHLTTSLTFWLHDSGLYMYVVCLFMHRVTMSLIHLDFFFMFYVTKNTESN